MRHSIYRVGSLTYTKPQLTVLFFWLLWGDFCFVLMEAVTPSIVPLKLKELGASNTTMSLALSTIPWALGMVLNPVISFRSDRFRSRMGRRIPFILFTVPPLVVCLVGLGFGERIGFTVHALIGSLARFSPETVAIGVIIVLLVMFTIFNSFVTSVFWYLFNDVVPEQLLARFMSWFRLVSLIAASLYNAFIFQYAGTHAAEIFIGVGLVYFVGFGLMCLNVKEGEYPPPSPYLRGGPRLVAAAKTYFEECHRVPHYWYQFLCTAFGALAGGGTALMIFFYQAIGLGLDQVGKLNACLTVATALLILGSGWLADRIHPIRVVLIGVFLNTFVGIPILLIWLVWAPLPPVAFWTMIGISICILAPISALIGVWDPPLLMRLFPRSHYGQFCSANTIWRSVGFILGSALIGPFLDFAKPWLGPDRVYLLLPVWQLSFSVPGVWATWMLYKSWLRLGADQHYIPPLTSKRPE